MSETDTPLFVGWEEQIICHEWGSRIIHFYLKDASGDSVLAVVGTEKSVRHMMYVVSDEFLQTYGSKKSSAACKWRARRGVIDWLTCLVSTNHRDLNVQLDDSVQAVEALELLSAGISANAKLFPDELVSRKLKFQRSDIEWLGIGWFCAKQLKHYPGFCRNETTICVHSFVYIMAEEESHCLGYLEDMYEDKKGQKKVKVRWFNHGQEVKRVIPQLNLQPGEVFITPHIQVISAECVNGPATVLTPKHYEKCMASVPLTSFSEVHMCCRQFKNKKLKPFTLTKLRGYSSQSVLSCLNSLILSPAKVKCHKLHREDDEDLALDYPLRPSRKRNRTAKGYQILEMGYSGMQNFAPGNQMTRCEPIYPRLKLRLSRKTMGIKVIGPKSQYHLSFKVDEKIELLCQDSGIRGCWFRCKILNASRRQLKVQYDDVLDVDGQRKLEEWVPTSRWAPADKLGMRCSSRLTIRPCPLEDTSEHTFEIGAPVDAWWSDGWWEGVVIAVNVCEVGTVQVYTPGEENFLTLEKKHIRVSRDWVGNRWVDIIGKPDICSFLSPNAGSSIKLSANSAMVDGSVSDCSAILECKSSLIPKVEAIQKDEPELFGLDVPDDLESTKGVTLRKPLRVIDEDEGNSGGCNDGDSDTDKDDNNDDTEEDSEENLIMEENFDSAQLRVDAAEAIQVT